MYFLICHYTPLVDRYKFIKKELDNKVGNMLYYNLEADINNKKATPSDISNNIDTTKNIALFVRKFDRDYLTNKIIASNYLSPHDRNHNIRLEFTEYPDYNNKLYTYDNHKRKYNHSLNGRGLKMSEMSLALKHYESLKIISQLDISYAMVIEDDCVFVKNFTAQLQEKIKLFPPDWDIYYPNSCPNPGFRTKGGYTDIKGTNKIAIKNSPTSVFGVSYLITKKAAIKIVNEIEKNKLWLAIDHELNWLCYTLQLKVIWNSQSPRLTFWGESGMKSSLIS